MGVLSFVTEQRAYPTDLGRLGGSAFPGPGSPVGWVFLESEVTQQSPMTLYIGVAVAGIIAAFVVGAMARKHAITLIRKRRIRVDRFKLRRKQTEIETEIFSAPEVITKIAEYAEEHQVSVDVATARAREYFGEIVPKFNLLAYYRFGAPVARIFLHLFYRVVVETKTVRAFDKRASKGTVTAYVVNHRSNADYVLVAHMLFKFISLSYAVGEWARVWPLNHLFKWFGAYFVRRGYREPLYHAILANYVRTITRRGVTQGVFIEGGLSRDGAFRKPKLGMLDYLVGSKRDPSFKGSLYVIPTAINYDRVLEDRILTDELRGVESRATKREKLRQTFGFLFKNLTRSLLRRFKRYGYAVVSFAEPVLVDDFIREHPEILDEDWNVRKPALEELASLIMRRISEVLPRTPVPLVARLLRERDNRPISEKEIVEQLDRLRVEWSDEVWHVREHSGEKIWISARKILILRRLIVETDAGWRWNPEEALLLEYYANSLVPFDAVKRRGWEHEGK